MGDLPWGPAPNWRIQMLNTVSSAREDAPKATTDSKITPNSKTFEPQSTEGIFRFEIRDQLAARELNVDRYSLIVSRFRTRNPELGTLQHPLPHRRGSVRPAR